jgi:CheY-like chemotaxis protein
MAGETVLIVEDRRENIVHLANNVLKPSGYRVITAMDGQRGLRRILNDRPDLVIMDLKMPKMDGLEVLATLQQRKVETPVILTTFYGSEQVAEQALRLGAVDYIVKPYDVDDMLHAVQEALARRPAPSMDLEEPDRVDETMPLTRQVERWMRDMNILTSVGKALVAQLDEERVCTWAVEAAIYLSRADHALLFLSSEAGEATLHLCASRGPRDRQVQYPENAMESDLVTEVARTGKTVFEPRGSDDATLAEIVGHPLASTIALPLRWQRRIVGVLVVARDPGEPAFGQADVEWLSGLAEYTAIAVRNAQAYQQAAQAPPLPEEMLSSLRQELDQLAAELRASREHVERLVALLDERNRE